ncbi:N-acetylmuramoyl-L-alanine amidase [Staphylococcus lutrae]|nr:N-acetylmuramoyl-L-alanine amidase [Staphylococcus lutrae]
MFKRFFASSLSIVVTLTTLCLTPTVYTRSLFGMPAFMAEASAATNHSQGLPPLPYPNVNQYIISTHLGHSPVVKDPRMDTLPQLPYKHGTYIGVVIHEVGEDYRSLNEWVDRMYATYDRAFVHAFVDSKEIHLTAPSKYLVWGAGKQANPYFYQIEVVRAYTFDDFARSVNNQAWLAAYMLKQNNIEPTLADRQEGVGSIISHYAVHKYWGGTTHVDPIEYFARWGYDMDQFFELVKYHYQQML